MKLTLNGLTSSLVGQVGEIVDYLKLANKPSINNIELTGNKTTSDLGLIDNTVNDLLNYYLKSETYSKTEVNTIVSNINQFRVIRLDVKPETGEEKIIYLIPKAGGVSPDIHDEWLWINNSWELIGNTQIDLSEYVKTADVNTYLALKQNVTDNSFTTTSKTVVGAINELNTGKLNKDELVYSYTFDRNTNIVVDSIDYVNYTFTSATPHGLSANSVVFPFMNNILDATSVYKFMPAELTPATPATVTTLLYYAIVVDTYTFKLSFTSGGSAIAFTTSVGVDISKFHFEKMNQTSFNITHDLALDNFYLKIRGKIGSIRYFRPLECLGEHSVNSRYGDIGISRGNSYFEGIVKCDMRYSTKLVQYDYFSRNSDNSSTIIEGAYVNVKRLFVNDNVVSNAWYVNNNVTVANGTTFEFWKVKND